jgi:D-glycero-D-manno-heptose 1,7-bisphosphate phosphatase
LKKALFLDRDGVINQDFGYVHQIENFELVPEIFALCKAAVERNYIIIVVTNQAGIGRGFYDEETFLNLTRSISEIFLDNGINITKTYFCPHHPVHGLGEYKKYCKCRKPEPGMFIKAAREYGIDMKSSIMVGDKLSDLQAARSAGVGTLVLFEDSACELPSNELQFNKRSKLADIIELLVL